MPAAGLLRRASCCFAAPLVSSPRRGACPLGRQQACRYSAKADFDPGQRDARGWRFGASHGSPFGWRPGKPAIFRTSSAERGKPARAEEAILTATPLAASPRRGACPLGRQQACRYSVKADFDPGQRGARGWRCGASHGTPFGWRPGKPAIFLTSSAERGKPARAEEAILTATPVAASPRRGACPLGRQQACRYSVKADFDPGQRGARGWRCGASHGPPFGWRPKQTRDFSDLVRRTGQARPGGRSRSNRHAACCFAAPGGLSPRTATGLPL